MKKRILFDLLLTFMKIGLFTFGGGYAMVSMIESICVEEKKWITHDDMMNVMVIAESTPGPIAINCATFVGYRQTGLAGSFIATLGMVFPSFVIIGVISMFLDNFLEIAVISNAFKGIRVAVGLLIWNAAITMMKKMNKKPLPRMIMVCSAGVMLFAGVFGWKLSSVSLMIIAAAISLTVFVFKDETGLKGGTKA